jgi:VRR-NUC domain
VTSEAAIQQQIRLALSKAGVVAFRNNVGQYTDPKTGRPIRYGLGVGSSDLIGWTPITVTPDMVGKTLAVFTAVEVKTDRGRPTDAQLNFIEQVLKAGGLAGIARSPEQAVEIATY